MAQYAFPQFRRFKPDVSGATAVEFALISPLFFIILFGVFQLSVATFKGNTAKRAVERGARIALVTPDLTEDTIQQAVDDILARTGTSIEVDIDLVFETETSISTAHISGTYVHVFTVPFLPELALNFTSSITVPRTRA